MVGAASDRPGGARLPRLIGETREPRPRSAVHRALNLFCRMKTAVFCLLIGALLGAIGWRYYQRAQNPTLGQRVETVADKARAAASDAQTAVADKAEDWKLTPENIKEELRKTGGFH